MAGRAGLECRSFHLTTEILHNDITLKSLVDIDQKRKTNTSSTEADSSVRSEASLDIGKPIPSFGLLRECKRRADAVHCQKTIRTVIEMAPNAQWRAIIALARFGGLRIPSELAPLRWNHIDLQAGSMTIHASKTEHHKGKGIRRCPIFPELRPYLEDLHKLSLPGLNCPVDSLVFPSLTTALNLRTQFERIIKRAGVEQWPKLFQNLRASRETELLALFPAKDVCSWIGNAQAIAMKHYAMATEESFKRAASIVVAPSATIHLSNQGPIVGNVGQNVGQSDAVGSRLQSSAIRRPNKKTAKTSGNDDSSGLVTTCDDESPKREMGGIGLEPTTSTMSTLRSNQLS